jgi:hypothetical protein
MRLSLEAEPESPPTKGACIKMPKRMVGNLTRSVAFECALQLLSQQEVVDEFKRSWPRKQSCLALQSLCEEERPAFVIFS